MPKPEVKQKETQGRRPRLVDAPFFAGPGRKALAPASFLLLVWTRFPQEVCQ